MIKIAIIDDYQNVIKNLNCFKLLKNYNVFIYTTPARSEFELFERLKDVDVLVLIRNRTIITKSLLKSLTNLKMICQTGKVGEHIDMEACDNNNIEVVEGGSFLVATAELCWTLILASSRRIVPYATQLKENQWQDSCGLGLGQVLNGKTLAIWGYGQIGKMIAKYGDAFGMDVVVWGSELSRHQAVQDGFISALSKDDFFETADVLSLHLKLNESTQNCVKYGDLKKMKRESLLVNTSRAGLIERGALYKALSEGCPGFAAVDVFYEEPVSAQSEPLLTLPNVLATPHLGYVELNSYELLFTRAFRNILSRFND